MRSFAFLIFASLSLLPTIAAQAASSEWHHVAGGSVRLVTSAAPDTDRRHLRGALEIRLKPGWKTYWRDPGGAGVPPNLEVMTGDTTLPVEIGFPAPGRFDDGYAVSAGYAHPVSLALTLTLPEGAVMPARLDADIFLGLCETICIPMQARLSVDLDAGTETAEHASVVESAFAALPRPSEPDFSARLSEVSDDALLIAPELPAGVQALDLFVAGTPSLTLEFSQKTQRGTQTLFRVPVAAHTSKAGEKLAYTLITDAGAVSGHIRLP